MRVRGAMVAVTIAAAVSMVGAVAVWASDTPVPPVSRIEVVLANHYKSQVSALTEEFVQAGMANVHFQFARRGQLLLNPALKARSAARELIHSIGLIGTNKG